MTSWALAGRYGSKVASHFNKTASHFRPVRSFLRSLFVYQNIPRIDVSALDRLFSGSSATHSSSSSFMRT